MDLRNHTGTVTYWGTDLDGLYTIPTNNIAKAVIKLVLRRLKMLDVEWSETQSDLEAQAGVYCWQIGPFDYAMGYKQEEGLALYFRSPREVKLMFLTTAEVRQSIVELDPPTFVGRLGWLIEKLP